MRQVERLCAPIVDDLLAQSHINLALVPDDVERQMCPLPALAAERLRSPHGPTHPMGCCGVSGRYHTIIRLLLNVGSVAVNGMQMDVFGVQAQARLCERDGAPMGPGRGR